MINYHSKVVLAVQPWDHDSIPSIDLFVFEAGKQDFKEMYFHNIPEPYIRMKGIINHTGEIIFALYSSKKAKVLCYYLKGASYKKMKIEVDWFRNTKYFLGYVESLGLL